MTKHLYCITHDEMVDAITTLGSEPVHLAQCGSPFEPEVDWCEGPYATCPPPEGPSESDWAGLFADEDRIKALLADYRDESEQPNSLI